MVAKDYLLEMLVEYTARKATKMNASTRKLEAIAGVQMARVAVEVGDRIAESLVHESRGLPRCSLCGHGPFTYRGLYLHLLRKHYDEIKQLLEEEFEYTVRMLKFVAP